MQISTHFRDPKNDTVLGMTPRELWHFLQKGGHATNLVILPGQPDDAWSRNWIEHADSLEVLNDLGNVVARLKSRTDRNFDSRGEPMVIMNIFRRNRLHDRILDASHFLAQGREHSASTLQRSLNACLARGWLEQTANGSVQCTATGLSLIDYFPPQKDA